MNPKDAVDELLKKGREQGAGERENYSMLLTTYYICSKNFIKQRELTEEGIKQTNQFIEEYRTAVENSHLLTNRPLHYQRIKEIRESLRKRVLRDEEGKEALSKKLTERN
jgi:hypothetical protein